MKKLKMHSPDLAAQNVDKLAKVFPTTITESLDNEGKPVRAIDFDLLRQELSDHVIDGPHERYQLDWPGKREALFAANAPIAKTLRPVREQSVNFDTTQNFFIEGDNLDALKLLQESYLGKVGLIYIDPPYNTGNDFVYEDDFAETTEEYLARSGQVDEAGTRLVVNLESNGRFHSDWLSMMYPRLKLARNLLTSDGVIVMSIDENEVANLRLISDQVFGASNFLFQIAVLSNPKGRSQDKYVARCHDYLVGYSRGPLPKGAVNIPKSEEEISANFRLKDGRGAYRELELRNTHREFGKPNRPNLFYPFWVRVDGSVSLEKEPRATEVLPIWDDGFEGCWTWSRTKARTQLDELVGKVVAGAWKVYRKAYAYADGEAEASKQVKSLWTEKAFHTEKGQAHFNSLFESREKLFPAPKPVDLIRRVLQMGSSRDTIVLDFFAGSGTTAQAVFEQNAADRGNRRFILVQVSEVLHPSSAAFQAGYSNVAELSRERIRRAGAKAVEETGEGVGDLDVGFRAFRIDTTNMGDVLKTPDALGQDQLGLYVDNLKPDRTGEDLLFQVLLDWGLELTMPIAVEETEGCQVFVVEDGALIACFGDDVSPALVREVAARQPLRAVFRDSGFATDSDRINAEQVFAEVSPATDVKAL